MREVVPFPFRQTSPLTEMPRLFATNVAALPDAILEIDPQTGATLNTFNAPVDTNNSTQGLAFDGTTLYFLDAINDRLFELDPDDGTVLDSTLLPNRAYDGVAALNGLVYAIDTGLDDILVFDPVSDTVLNTLDLNAVNPGHFFFGGIGESGGELVAATSTNQVVFLDPTTGVVTGSFDHGLPSFDGGLTGFGGEIYLGFSSSSLGVRVFDRDGNPQRALDVNFPVFGLGGAVVVDDAHRVTLESAQNLTGLNFGNQNILGSISGTKFEDVDGDGMRDPGEGPLEGVTIYLDLNDNGLLDVGGAAEPDDFAAGTDVGTAFPGVTLSVLDSSNNPLPFPVTATVDSFGFASTGTQVFGHANIPFFNSFRRLKMDFDAPASQVSIDFAGGNTVLTEVGRLEIYDADDNLLDTYLTEMVNGGGVETMTLARPAADIAYAIAYTNPGEGSFGRLDNLVFGTLEPSTTTDADGHYEFANLQPDDYIVREVVPFPFRQTLPLMQTPRLFATNVAASPDAIREIDPQTGATLNTFDGPVNANTALHGLAFDGTTLYYLDSLNDTLFELDLDDGTILDSTLLPNRSYDGVAALGGLVYVIDTGLDDILVFDPVSDTVLNTLDLNAVNPGHFFFGGIGESGGELVAATSTNQVVFLDPTTGVVTGSFDHGLPSFDGGLTGFGGEIYLGFFSTTFDIRVFDRDGNPQRALDVNFPVFGLGGAVVVDDAHRVTLGPAEDLTGFDFGNQNINVAPTIDTVSLDSAIIDENSSVELTGTFSDPDSPHLHTVVIDWGDGNPNTIIDLTDGENSFTASHTYADDGPSPGNGTPSDEFHIIVTVADAFGGSVTAGAVTEQLLTNGGFESGDFTGWTTVTTGNPFRPWAVSGAGEGSGSNFAPTMPQEGSFVAWNGFDGGGPMEFQLFQDVAIEPGASSADLSWMDRVQWNFTLGATATLPRLYDVEIRDPDTNAVLQTVFSFSTGTQAENPTGDTDWQSHSVDLSAFAGQTVRVFFREQIPQSATGPGQLEIDAVQLTQELPLVVTVNNVAPAILSFVDPAPIAEKADEGEPVTLAFDFTDPGTLDVHTAVIDWGDGNNDTRVLPLGDRSLSLDHTYATGGVFTVTVTLTDDDNGSDAFTTTAFVTGVGVLNGELQIVGTSGDDHVTVIQQGNGLIRVLGSFLPEAEGRTFDASAVNSIVAVLCEGDDHMIVAGNIDLPALIDAGGGNDNVVGGGGTDIILGRDGDDQLNGGGGLDVLIGGGGVDELVGGPGSDLLFGGIFAANSDSGNPVESFADDAADLRAVRAIWNDPDRDVADRAADVEALDSFFSKLFDDESDDELTGEDGDD